MDEETRCWLQKCSLLRSSVPVDSLHRMKWSNCSAQASSCVSRHPSSSSDSRLSRGRRRRRSCRRKRSRNSRLESESGSKKQANCKRKGRPRSNTHAIPRSAHTVHDGQMSHSSVSMKGSEDLSRKPVTAMDYYFLKPNSTASSQTIPDESVTCIAVKEDRHHNIMSSVVLKKGTEAPWASKRVARFINSLGDKEITLKSDTEPGIIAFRNRVAEHCKMQRSRWRMQSKETNLQTDCSRTQ